jgi:hypothetical protein
MENFEIGIHKHPDGSTRIICVSDPSLYANVSPRTNGEHTLLLSWEDINLGTYDAKSDAMIDGIDCLEKEMAKRNQPKPLTAKEAFEKYMPAIETAGGAWANPVWMAVELYVTSQIEHLKKELQK